MISKFMRNGCREKNRLFAEEVLQDDKKRSKSLNPLIYPEWWGDDNDTSKDAI